MTKRKAIRECKRLWRLVLQGKAKNKAEALKLLPEFFLYFHECPLCQYKISTTATFPEMCRCLKCPLVEQTGWKCTDIDYLKKPEIFASVIMALKE